MSIKEIAKKTGVSPSTVSRVLNHPEYRCSTPGMREKIWKEAMTQNYVPNEAARNLKMGKRRQESQTYYINVLMTRTKIEQPDPFFTEVLRVVESEIHKNGCILTKVWYMPAFSNTKSKFDWNGKEKIRQMCEEADGKKDGLVVIGKCNKEVLQELKKYYNSMVSINRNSTDYEIDEVLCDGSKVAALAVEHLISLGHQNIGYIGACQNEARYHGYLDTLRKHNIDIEPDFVFKTNQTEEEGYECMEKLLKMDELPTGIYCANDITAVGILKCLKKHKSLYYTPSIISSDDIELAQTTQPMLTTVHLPKDEMGKMAIYLLLDRLKGGHEGIIRTEVQGKLMIRNSCTPVEQSVWSDYSI